MEDSSRSVVKEKLDELGLIRTEDGYVDWDPTNARHPRNWNAWAKCYNVALISWLEMYQTALSTSGVSLFDARSMSVC